MAFNRVVTIGSEPDKSERLPLFNVSKDITMSVIYFDLVRTEQTVKTTTAITAATGTIEAEHILPFCIKYAYVELPMWSTHPSAHASCIYVFAMEEDRSLIGPHIEMGWVFFRYRQFIFKYSLNTLLLNNLLTMCKEYRSYVNMGNQCHSSITELF